MRRDPVTHPPEAGASLTASRPVKQSSPNVSAWLLQKRLPVASDGTVTARAAAARPRGDAGLEEPLLQSQI